MLIQDQPDYGESKLELELVDEQFRAMADEADRESAASARVLGYWLLAATFVFFGAIFWAVFA